LRLSKAAEELLTKPSKVIDVAFDFVFDPHEGFTRAFFRQFGESPKKFSRGTGPVGTGRQIISEILEISPKTADKHKKNLM
jgi:AraC-like DNA-binding protein